MLFCRSAVKHRTSSTTVGSPLFVPNVRRSHISLQESLCDFPIDPSRSFDGFAIRHPLRRSPHTHLSNYNIGWDPVLHRRAPTPCTDSVPDLPDFYQVAQHKIDKLKDLLLNRSSSLVPPAFPGFVHLRNIAVANEIDFS